MTFRILLLAGLAWLLAGSVAWAEQGPRVPPCDGCPTSQERPQPRGGFWYDPARSGSGMTLDVQNGVLAGAYYGYDAQGRPTWYLFSGALQPAEQPAGYWTLSADLLEFAGGNCIDCQYQRPEVARVRARLHLTVVQRNLISYRLDDGEVFRMQPLVWGTPMQTLFPAVTDLLLPQFDSSGDSGDPWVLSVRGAAIDVPPLLAKGVYWVKTEVRVDTATYSMQFDDRIAASPPMHDPTYLQCGSTTQWPTGPAGLPDRLRERLGTTPVCILRVYSHQGTLFYTAPLGDLSDDYFIFTAEDGRSVIEGQRLLYR